MRLRAAGERYVAGERYAAGEYAAGEQYAAPNVVEGRPTFKYLC